jgi:hypothetical protein
MGVLTQHLFAELPPIREVNPNAVLSREIELVIQKALAKDPSDRYQDTDQLAEAVRCALDGRLSRATAMTPPAVTAPPAFRDYDPVPRRKAPRWMWAATVLGAVGALAWGVFGSSQGQGSPSVPEEPREPKQTMVTVADNPDPVPEEPVVEAVAAPELVRVHVATDPVGAVVVMGNGSEACERAPCTLETQPGETLVLRAKLGKRRGRVAITPTEDATVLIELKAPRKATPKPQAVQEKPRRRAARSSDLKVPEWAQ